uniref:Uncharacterized protein n=1 Tax=Anguilla anguilla TaxID=7936 RepID=A0A0E9X6J5_ANGAN
MIGHIMIIKLFHKRKFIYCLRRTHLTFDASSASVTSYKLNIYSHIYYHIYYIFIHCYFAHE